jgi:serine/arginine repetitive matrix protein 2
MLMCYEIGLRLDLLAVTTDSCDSTTMAEDPFVTAVTLRFPHGLGVEEHQLWINAVRRCHSHFLRSLSFPSHTGRFLSHGTGVDTEADTKRSLLSILAAGLPFPKSPSVQIKEQEKGDVSFDDIQLEREERGWWTLRFQQVLREMQRSEAMA